MTELGIPNLDKSSQAEPKPSSSTKKKKCAFLFKPGIFEGAVRQRHQNRGAGNSKSRIMSFTKAGMTFWSVKVLQQHDLRRMEAN